MRTVLFSNQALYNNVVNFIKSGDTESLIKLLNITDPEDLSFIRANSVEIILKEYPYYFFTDMSWYTYDILEEFSKLFTDFTVYLSNLPTDNLPINKFIVHNYIEKATKPELEVEAFASSAYLSFLVQCLTQFIRIIYIEKDDLFIETSLAASDIEEFNKFRIRGFFSNPEHCVDFFHDKPIGSQLLTFIDEYRAKHGKEAVQRLL